MKTKEIPFKESPHLIDGYRTEDTLVGPLAEFYFNITFAGYYVCRKTFSIKRYDMNSVFLMITIAGEGELLYRGRQYRLSPHSVMLIDTRIYHEYHALEEGWTFKYIHFQGGMSASYYTYIDSHLGSVFQVQQNLFREIEEHLDAILQETGKTINLDYADVSSRIYTILTLFLSHRNMDTNSEKSNVALQLALAYITGNYHQKISTNEIAAAAYLSRSYLSELFKKTYGIGPHEYLTMYRLSQAKKQLLHTKNSIAQIAVQTGFRDIYMFSRVFRKMIGTTPSEYRKSAVEFTDE